MAKRIFDTVRLVVRHKDASIAQQLLPHLVLNVLVSGEDDDTKKILFEITAVLEDQLDEVGQSSPEKRLLSAQVSCTHPPPPPPHSVVYIPMKLGYLHADGPS